MKCITPVLAVSFAAIYRQCSGCQTVSVESDLFGDTAFVKMGSSSPGSLGRSSYIAVPALETDVTLYLYFGIENVTSGSGRWIINEKLAVVDHALAFVDTWAVEPYLVGDINDGEASAAHWQSYSDGGWRADSTMTAFCTDGTGDTTVYFDSSTLQPTIAGFYVMLTPGNEGVTPVYSHVRMDEEYWPALFLYKIDQKWMIGEKVGDDACLTFVNDDAMTASEIKAIDWHFISAESNNTSWEIDYSYIISTKSFPDRPELYIDTVYDALREARSIKSVPEHQHYFTLRNNLPMPTMGLGTGGLYEGRETFDTLLAAMKLGYRLFDLAREYNNEETLAAVIKQVRSDDSMPVRDELFIETKVWPTDLGFSPTTQAIEISLDHLSSNYVDLYLLHWPFCDATVEWMHCETTVDPAGTWRQSWRAMERAYAEGRVMSIGVSNFDVGLLDEMLEFAVVKPHVVQNFAEPGRIDNDVRKWCREHEVVYQPYASIRNLDTLPTDISSALHRIAAEKAVSPHSVAIRFFIQSGSGVIPRSKDENHLKENLEAFRYSLSDAEMHELGWTEPVHAEL